MALDSTDQTAIKYLGRFASVTPPELKLPIISIHQTFESDRSAGTFQIWAWVTFARGGLHTG